MKKLVFCLVAAAMAFCATGSAMAQKVGFGAKAGANLSTWSQDNSDMRVGFHAGLYANIKINNLIAIQPEVLYSMEGRNWEFDSEDFGIMGWFGAEYNVNTTVHKLAVPLMLQITPIKPLTLEVGPQFGFNLGMSSKSELTSTVLGGLNAQNELQIDEDNYNMFELGLAVGAKLNLAGNMALGVRYVYGITPLFDEFKIWNTTIANDVTTHNLMLSFSLGF